MTALLTPLSCLAGARSMELQDSALPSLATTSAKTWSRNSIGDSNTARNIQAMPHMATIRTGLGPPGTYVDFMYSNSCRRTFSAIAILLGACESLTFVIRFS